MMMTSDTSKKNEEDGNEYLGPSKSQLKRDSQHMIKVGEDILKLKPADLESLNLPDELEVAVATALKIKSRSGLKRQRQYIGKLLRSIDSEDIENKLRKIQHSHDTNTAQFKRLEKWRDQLIENNKETLNEVISKHPDIDRQQLNQIIRAAHQEKKQEKPPTAAKKLFKYLRELEENSE